MRSSSDTADPKGGRNQPMKYEDYKREVLQRWFMGGVARLDKQSFKQITKQLRTVVDVDSRNASQLWQMVEEDTQGVVNKSYIEEIFDVVYEQQQERQDMQFELSNGLRYVHQTVFKNPDTYRVSLQDCIEVVQKGFNTGHQQLIDKIATIVKNGSVDRVEFMDLIEQLEQKQMYEAETNISANYPSSIPQVVEGGTDELVEFDENEEYSEARDREILGQLRVRMECITKELDKIQSHLRTSHPNLLREVQTIAKPMPRTLKSYGNYTKKIQFKLDELRSELESLKSSKSAASGKTADALREANDQIFALQAELEEKNRVMAGVVQDALHKFQEKISREFGAAKIELEEQIVALEGKLSASEKALRTAENSVTFLLSANTNLESKVKIATEFKNPKIQQMLERAMDDPSFFEKVVQAVSIQEKAANQGRQDPFTDEVDLEKQDLKEQVDRLTRVNEDSSDFIRKLQEEIRQLKEKAQSVYQPQSGVGISVEEGAGSQFGIRESIMLDKQPSLDPTIFPARYSIAPTPAVELDYWCDTILKIEGKNILAPRVKQLESELNTLSIKSNQDQADLRDARRNCEALDQELRLIKQERINLESTVGILKSDLSSKMIQIGNLTSQVASLQTKLAQQVSQSSMQVAGAVQVTALAEPEKPDYELDSMKQKTNQILANNSLLESLKKPRAPKTEPGEAIFRNGVRVLDTLDKTTSIIDLCIPGRIKSGNMFSHEKDHDEFDFKAGYLKKVAEKTELQDKLEALQKKLSELEHTQNVPTATPIEPETHDLGLSAIDFGQEKPAAQDGTSTDVQTEALGESQFGDPAPSTVPLEEYQEIKEKYDYRLVELDQRAEQVEKLNRHCEELVRRIAETEERYEFDIKAEREKFQTVQKELSELSAIVELLKQELELSKTQMVQLASNEQDASPKKAEINDVEKSSLYESTIELEIQEPPKLMEAIVMEQAEEAVNVRQSLMNHPTRTSVLNANHFSVASVSRLLPIAAQEQIKEMEQSMQDLHKKLEEKDMLIGNLRDMIVDYQNKLAISKQDQGSQTDPLPENSLPIQPAILSQSVFNVSPSKSAIEGLTMNGIRKIYEERIQRLSDRIEALELSETKLKTELGQLKKKDEGSLGNLIGAQLGVLTSLFTTQKQPEPSQAITDTFGKKEVLSSMFGMEITPSSAKKGSESIQPVATQKDEEIPDELPEQKGSGGWNIDVLLPSTILQEKYAPKEARPVKPIQKPSKQGNLFESVLFDVPTPGTSNPYLEENPYNSTTSQNYPKPPSSKYNSEPQQRPTTDRPIPPSKDISLNLPTSQGQPRSNWAPGPHTNYPAPPTGRPDPNLGHLFGMPDKLPSMQKAQQPSHLSGRSATNPSPLPPGFLSHAQTPLPPGFLADPFPAPRPQPSFGVVQLNQPVQHDAQSKHPARPSIRATAFMHSAFKPKTKQAEQISSLSPHQKNSCRPAPSDSACPRSPSTTPSRMSARTLRTSSSCSSRPPSRRSSGLLMTTCHPRSFRTPAAESTAMATGRLSILPSPVGCFV